jgi:HEAT repeat protein
MWGDDSMTGTRSIIAALALLAAPGVVGAQSLARRVDRVQNGTVRLTFAAREGVCGDGATMIQDQRHRMNRSDDGWTTECPCEHGPVRITLIIRDHRVIRIRTAVGGAWPAAAAGTTDLGTIGATAAADYLLALAGSNTEGAKDAVFPATLADSTVVWPKLLVLARNSGSPDAARTQAVFWLGQAAEDAATGGLDELVSDEHGDREVRRQAVFALSQRPRDEAVPALIRVARTNRDPEIRRQAIFWLGQSNDPRALALFEELLTLR